MDFEIDVKGANSRGGASPAAGIDIAKRLRQLRQERGWTLSEASHEIGLAHSTLSKIERDELSPTLATIQKIAEGLKVDVVDLLSGAPAASGRGRRSVTRASRGSVTNTVTCANSWLASDLVKKKMLPFHTKVTTDDVSKYQEWQFHDGEVFVFVLKGNLVVHSELYEPVELCKGDSIYYDATMGHKWTKTGEEDCEVLWVYAE